MSAQIISFCKPRVFTLEEAEELLPLIRKLTKKSLQQYLVSETRLKHLPENSEKRREVEKEMSTLLNRWSEQISRLGCHPKGIWLVDFDNGRGYYCWQYNEGHIGYFHHYHESVTNRTALEELSWTGSGSPLLQSS